jgi:hypothetical protein
MKARTSPPVAAVFNPLEAKRKRNRFSIIDKESHQFYSIRTLAEQIVLPMLTMEECSIAGFDENES